MLTAVPPETPDPAFLVDCDFEDAINLCHYKNSKSDGDDWYRRSGSLNSKEIGPVADHTYGNGKGFCFSKIIRKPRSPDEWKNYTSWNFTY